MKVTKLLKQGYLFMKRKSEEQEKTKLSNFRGGSSGHYDSIKDEWRGQCPRRSLLRYLGIQTPIDYTSYQNFVTGIYHEQNLITLLINNPEVKTITIFDKPEFFNVVPETKLVLKDESLMYKISDDVVVSCRPDLVVDAGSKFGIEAKATVSEDKATKSFSAPFVYAICQAALYKKILGIEYYLVYGNYTNYGQFYSKWGTYCESFVKTFKNGNKKPMKEVCPFYSPPPENTQNIEIRQFATGNYYKKNCQQVSYRVYFAKGMIKLEDEFGNKIDTGLTVDGIDGYFIKLKECMDKKELPKRPVETELYGEPSYSTCQYCELNETCKRYDQRQLTYDQYVECCSDVCKELNSKVENELIKGE